MMDFQPVKDYAQWEREQDALDNDKSTEVNSMKPETTLKVGDRVETRYDDQATVVNVNRDVYNTIIKVKYDNGKCESFYATSLTKLVPADAERAELVAKAATARDELGLAAQNLNTARAAWVDASRASEAANDAVRDYDEAKREPSVREKLDALGLGAVIKGKIAGNEYVKVYGGRWSNEGGMVFRPATSAPGTSSPFSRKGSRNEPQYW